MECQCARAQRHTASTMFGTLRAVLRAAWSTNLVARSGLTSRIPKRHGGVVDTVDDSKLPESQNL